MRDAQLYGGIRPPFGRHGGSRTAGERAGVGQGIACVIERLEG